MKKLFTFAFLITSIILGSSESFSYQVKTPNIENDSNFSVKIAQNLTPELPKTEDEIRFQEIIDKSIEENWFNLDMGELMQKVSEQFLGASYQAGLLDQSETETLITSLTQFDCVLFVETVLALARNIALQDYQYQTFTKNIENQRYRNGEMTNYCSRLHYFSEWISDNQKRNNVKNITAELGGIVLDKKLNFMSQHRDSYRQLVDDNNYKCIENMEENLENLVIYYLPTDDISKHYQQLQPGDIIGVVTSISGLDMTHTGLVYKTDENVGLIHASPAGKVTIANDLQQYISKVDYAVGIIVTRPLDPR